MSDRLRWVFGVVVVESVSGGGYLVWWWWRVSLRVGIWFGECFWRVFLESVSGETTVIVHLYELIQKQFVVLLVTADEL